MEKANTNTSSPGDHGRMLLYKVLRISQLDANELDDNLVDIIRIRLENVSKYLEHSKIIQILSPEINTIFRLVIWKYSLYDHGQSVGQRLLNIRYHNTHSSGDRSQYFHPTSKSQRVWLGILLVCVRYVEERLDHGVRMPNNISRQISRMSLALQVLTQLISMMNFFLFLIRGKHQHWWERVLGVRAVTVVKPTLRQPAYDFMNRELLWHTFSELLVTLLPLINYHKLVNMYRRYLHPSKHDTSPGDGKDLTTCSICSQPPVHPHHIGCNHVYCYYCIKANYLADDGFECPQCFYPVTHDDAIQPVR